jgi:sialic acid synthase
MRDCTVIAEVGCNHMGDMDIARQFIDSAHDFCEVFHIKFQKRNPKELLSEDQYSAPHPVPHNSFGSSYGEHREFLELSMDQHKELQTYCEARDMVYATSVWDVTSLQEVIDLNPRYIKIPSATNTHYELMELACKDFKGDIHVSLGMTTRAEEKKLIELFNDHNRLGDVVLYACTSGYPIAPGEACLMEVPRLIEAYGESLKAVGYSGHHNGIAIDVAAFTLGATYIERHFTLDRTWKGTDHAASLEPDGLRRLVRNLQYTAAALQPKATEILPIEEEQRKKLKWAN